MPPMSGTSDHPPVVLTPETEEQYLLHDVREIRWLLQSLIDARALISAHIAPGDLTCPTALLELYDDDTVLLDGNLHGTINQRLGSCQHVLCVSQLERVRVQFRLAGLEAVEVDGKVAFQAPLPETMLRLQRRELFRLPVPASHTVLIKVPVAEPGETAQPVDLRVVDISGGGIAVVLPDDGERFQARRRFPGCTLQLPDVGAIPVHLEITYVSRHEQRGGAIQLRAGCRFVDLPHTLENQVLNYIFRTERQRNARERLAG